MVNDQNLPRNIFNSLQITILEKQVIESLRQWSTKISNLFELDRDQMIADLVEMLKQKDCKGRVYLNRLLTFSLNHYNDED